ncbi:CRISPR-associated protein Csn1 [Alloprevotella tannerae]|uniref:type II CRISPR RNA-guided endonuclease Cas9 n=1 Tax=Alloprevotella tannerae TaxID=76122 RepID=UPI001EDA6CF7|nr:type II CRISPR RNA-guided endonuclease Cas9 [Alloprevotella tannerae]MCG2646241.1 CRISPR-associated protein Csn1 [Alloprevotella tannerae]
MKTRILGLDTGTNSLGWAVVDRDENNQYTPICRGDLIFTEGVKQEKGIEFSLAAERTSYRASRRHYFRRRLRKVEVLKVLVKHKLCPPLSDEALNRWHTKKEYPLDEDFILWQRTNEADNKNPYHDRHICLHRKLNLKDSQTDRYTLGRALYHLTQRRGFLSNRLDQNEEAEETGKVKSAISELCKEMKEAGCEFLGDYFYLLYRTEGNRVRIRSRYTDREKHYLQEFKEICRVQELDKDLAKALEKTIFFQRPLKSQRQGVGKCTMEKGHSRCAVSHPLYEEYRMLCYLNNIRIKTPSDDRLRPLNAEEREKITPLFYQKSNFDFKKIAKKLAGKTPFGWIRDEEDWPYQFNYRMTQEAPACPTTAQLIKVFGEDWKAALAETYTMSAKQDGTLKTEDEICTDIWNVLYSFSSKEKLKEFGLKKLQLDEVQAKAFSEIRLTRDFASLSLKAIRKILFFLRTGEDYSKAIFLANIPTIVGEEIWSNIERRSRLLYKVDLALRPQEEDDAEEHRTIAERIKATVAAEVPDAPIDLLYHPSMIEAYPDAKRNERFDCYQLGSPKTNAVRNPMAMRSLHMVRKVINHLLRKHIIDEKTEIHIEYARELNDANKRQAIADWQRELSKRHTAYAQNIRQLYKAETGLEIEPTKTDILKYQFWEEQQHVCLYTGKKIGIADFLGANPKFDVEHTIPRSRGGDSTQENLTLCESKFNRDIKRDKLPTELANYEEILARIEHWKKQCYALKLKRDGIRTHSGLEKSIKDSKIRRRHLVGLEYGYLKGKYDRFTMKEVPEGFSRRQGAGIGLISKYAGLFLKSLFKDPKNPNRSNVYVVKGAITAEFRKLWGLQQVDEAKSRENHTHHCIDAYTIACIGPCEYAALAEYYQSDEEFKYGRRREKPQFEKPWPTFTEDLLKLQEELLIVHQTTDKLGKRDRRKVKTPRGKFLTGGDSARGRLHQETYYGAINYDGNIKYVVRKPLDSLTEKDLDKIVDETVKGIVKGAVEAKGSLKEALADGIYMNKEKGILIRRVRIFSDVSEPINLKQLRDVSTKEYKRHIHLRKDENYLFAIYEGIDKKKNKKQTETATVDYLDAAKFYKDSKRRDKANSLVGDYSKKNKLPLKCILKKRQMVLFYEHSPEEIRFKDKKDLSRRLYIVTSIAKDGRVKFLHHQAATATGIQSSPIPFTNDGEHQPYYRLSASNIKVLVAGIDFDINILGEITPKL